jgi:Family of unknown function (DUF5317)
MLLIVVALALGILLGLAMGGKFTRLADIRFRWWGFAFAGLALQLIPVPSRPGHVDHWAAVGLLMGSYVALLVFVLANIRQPGFPLIAAGFALNALVISVNGGMPVSDHALKVASGPFYQQTIHRLTTGGGEKHHLQRPDDILTPIADVIPIGAPLRQVLSVGDILWLAGTTWVIARGMTGTGARSPQIPGGVPGDGPASPWGQDEGRTDVNRAPTD